MTEIFNVFALIIIISLILLIPVCAAVLLVRALWQDVVLDNYQRLGKWLSHEYVHRFRKA